MNETAESAPRRVVVAIDASDAGRQVLEDAARLAARLQAELVGQPASLFDCLDSYLPAAGVNKPHFFGANPLVHPWFVGDGRPPVSSFSVGRHKNKGSKNGAA